MKCNQRADSKREPLEVKGLSIYVGKTSRTIFERQREYWVDWRSWDY